MVLLYTNTLFPAQTGGLKEMSKQLEHMYLLYRACPKSPVFSKKQKIMSISR